MEYRIMNSRPTPRVYGEVGRALIRCGLWLRVAFVGACALAAGLIALFDGEVELTSALALAVGGGALAAIGAWRCRNALDDAAPVTAGVSSVVAPESGRAALLASSIGPARGAMADAAAPFAASRPEVSS